MAETKALLVLRLEGALQAWGEMSKWDFRDSADLPTKSGIVGLLGCALGLERGDPELSALSESVRLAIRADRPGVRTVDFQTVTGDPLRNAEGKPKSGGNTIISRHAYLQDACFTVFLETISVAVSQLPLSMISRASRYQEQTAISTLHTYIATCAARPGKIMYSTATSDSSLGR